MAQEREKLRIVIASVLKPVQDTRMFEKMGMSLAKSGLYEVVIIGFPIQSQVEFKGIRFESLPFFPRISFARWFARWTVFSKVLSFKPDVLIFNTHELLIPALCAKVLINTSIIYDVRENYFRNILHSGSFPKIFRWLIALLVRFKEKLLAPAIDHFFLAESGYEREFTFHRGGWTVLENKVSTITPASFIQKGKDIQLLFTGTLSESTGVYIAIDLARKLNAIDPTVSLTIAGYASLEKDRMQIHQIARMNSFIKVIGVDRLVPHPEIIHYIQASHAGILSYPPSGHTQHSHPTKLFEYLHYKLPIILAPRWDWITRFEKSHPFILFDFDKDDPAIVLKALKDGTYYTSEVEATDWTSEEPKLLEAISRVKRDR